MRGKFAHFAGDLEYWVLDSDPAARRAGRRALACDIEACPAAEEQMVEMASTQLEDGAPSASLDELEVWGSPAQPRAPLGQR